MPQTRIKNTKDKAKLDPPRRHGIYTSIAHWPGCGFFLSVTVPGRILNVAYSMFSKLLLATYTAGLASNLVVSRSPLRVIKDISSFQYSGIPACVLNRTSHLDFIKQARAALAWPAAPTVVSARRVCMRARRFSSVAPLSRLGRGAAHPRRSLTPCSPPPTRLPAVFYPQNYPKLQVTVIPSGAPTSALLSAVQRGACGGAVSTNVHLQYGIGLGDVEGRFCDLSATGPNLGVGLYALPFHLRTSDAVIEALGQMTSAAITDNTYYNRAMSVHFGLNRTACSLGPPVSKAKSLDLPDTARTRPKKPARLTRRRPRTPARTRTHPLTLLHAPPLPPLLCVVRAVRHLCHPGHWDHHRVPHPDLEIPQVRSTPLASLGARLPRSPAWPASRGRAREERRGPPRPAAAGRDA